MAQFYPDAMCDMNMNRAKESGGLTTPPPENFETDAMRGSMQEILSENLGQYVVCEFLIGTQAMTRKEGILYSVGRSYVVLYDDLTQTFVVCDIFSIKFVTFYLPGQRPGGRPVGQSTTANVPIVNVPGLDGVPASAYGLGAGAGVRSTAQQREMAGSRTLGR